jgi:hypothetical protein
MSEPLPECRSKLLLSCLVSLLAAGLVIYSQTAAFAWDEGYHLLAAQLIGRGKIPYIDFFFPQTPLNAYWNAGWMRLFGDTWRTAHAVSALMTALAVLLTADYLLRRFPVPGWRLASAIAAVFIAGLNVVVFEFGTIGQAYGLALFLIIAAFRLTVQAVECEGLLQPAAAGFFACAAANSTLLTAPIAPVLLLWMLAQNRRGSRRTKMAAFVAAGAIPFLPLVWLFVLGPRLTMFNVIEYHLFYRRVQWEGATAHDIGVMAAWLDSSQAFLLGLLAVGGLLFVARRSQWRHEQRAEFYLCGWLAAALIVHIASGHPNFERYYLFAVPFLGILASAGLYAAGSRLVAPDRPFWPVAVVSILVCLGLAKSLYDEREDFNWRDVEAIARKVNEVTPPQAALLADELTYFVSRHGPPSGMELADSHKLDFPAGRAAELHVISRAELERRIQAGAFDTVETWDTADRIAALGLPRLYTHRVEVAEANLFWGASVPGARPGP